MTTASRTLRDLSGLPDQPCRLRSSALIIVDAQNTYREGVMKLEGIEPALDECRTVLARARALGTPVFHIQHDAGPGTPYDIRADIGAIADKVAPSPGEPVIVKHYPNSFFDTDLGARLQALDRTQLVIVGFMTHVCIHSTARGAFNLGYQVTVAGSATATRALPVPGGGVVDAATLQRSSLAALADMFAVVVPDVADIPD